MSNKMVAKPSMAKALGGANVWVADDDESDNESEKTQGIIVDGEEKLDVWELGGSCPACRVHHFRTFTACTNEI